MNNNFYAILDDGKNSIRRIQLTTELVHQVRNIFTEAGNNLIGEGLTFISFDGNYSPEDDEVLFVEMEGLPDMLADLAKSAISIRVLDFSKETIKALLWYEESNETFYFQNFDQRKRLDHKFVLLESKDTFNRLQENAFIVEKNVNGAYQAGKFYFRSYANANKIISLSEYFKIATELDIRTFATDPKLSFNPDWLIKKGNSTIKKQIAKVINTGILSKYDTSLLQKAALVADLELKLDNNNKIIIPEDLKSCKSILTFLYQGRFKGLITEEVFETNSQRKVPKP